MTNAVKPVLTVMSVLFAAIAALMLATPIQAEELPKVRFVTSEGAFELAWDRGEAGVAREAAFA